MESNLFIMETVFPNLYKSKSHYGFEIENNPETEAEIRNHLKQIVILEFGSFLEHYMTQNSAHEYFNFQPNNFIDIDTLKAAVDFIDDESLKKIYSENFHERDVFSIIKSMFLPD